MGGPRSSLDWLQEDSGLIIEFAQLPALLLRLLNLLVDLPATYQASLLLHSNGAAELEFAQVGHQ
jgi:hypothetical protein